MATEQNKLQSIFTICTGLNWPKRQPKVSQWDWPIAGSVARWRFSKPNLGGFGVLEVVWHFLAFLEFFWLFRSCLTFFKKKMAVLAFFWLFSAHLSRKWAY
jgi:hypothetical protein